MEYYLKAWRNYANFSGRARRTEYWMFVLFNTLISLLILGISFALMEVLNTEVFFLIYVLYALAVMIPSIALSIRRIHDVGYSGWMFLLCLVPFVGGIILLVFYLLDSQPGDNRFGPNPKSVSF